jgi:hypothetical protein
MKIELIREYDADGEALYLIKVDGSFVSGTITYNETVARKYYQTVVENRGVISISQVLESTILE